MALCVASLYCEFIQLATSEGFFAIAAPVSPLEKTPY